MKPNHFAPRIFFLRREQEREKLSMWQMLVRWANAVLEGTWILRSWKQYKNQYRRESILSYSISQIRESGRIG